MLVRYYAMRIFTRCGMRFFPVLLVSIVLVEYAGPQSSIEASRQRGGPPAPARGGSAAPARGGAAGSSGGVNANLGQLMKGILYPNSNVIFAAQTQNPAQVKPASDPATATDP